MGYVFNRVLGVDVNYLADSEGTTLMFLNMVDIGTGFQIEALLREGHGTPTSIQCFDATMLHWVPWAGYPKEFNSDRGLNNRGFFCKKLSAAGVYCGNIGLEEFINLTTALITEQDLSRSGEPSTFDLLFKKFDQRGDDYINLDSLRLVCRELGETLGSGSEQSDEQLKDMLRFAKHDEGAAGGGPLQVTKQELWDCLSRTRLMK